VQDRGRVQFEYECNRLLGNWKQRWYFDAVGAPHGDRKIAILLLRAARLQTEEAAIGPPMPAE
jgi:hypothetical protein